MFYTYHGLHMTLIDAHGCHSIVLLGESGIELNQLFRENNFEVFLTGPTMIPQCFFYLTNQSVNNEIMVIFKKSALSKDMML